ncbi:MAG: hypothetical protein FJY74_04715 [Candidatus Eisenbacteria bacterium]|nr:hypothetical protein [Candidatus Eisenbacteria bacterium]
MAREHAAPPEKARDIPTRRPGPRALRAAGVVAVLMVFTAPNGSPAFPAGARLTHVPPVIVEERVALQVEAALTGLAAADVAAADVVVLTPSGERAFPLSLSGSVLLGAIPADLVLPAELRYYLRVTDLTGDALTAPPSSPAPGWYAVAVAGRASVAAAADLPPASLDPGIEVITPLPGEIVPGRRPDVVAVLDPPLESPWTAVVLLDGRDVTDAAELRSDHFYLSPPESLSVGAHTVVFSALTSSRAVEGRWMFFVQEALWVPRTPEPDATAAPTGETWESAPVLSGFVKVGWAAVAADAADAESLEVFLPYEEVSAPSLDLYASSLGVGSTWMATARYDPLFDERLSGAFLFESSSFDAEAGDIYPSLTRATLEWASGLGARAAVRVGPTRTDVVALRLAEADTTDGWGAYARYALGAKETVAWGTGSELALAFLHAFDDTATVAAADRVVEPVENDVLAARLLVRGGRRFVEAEAARSWSSGVVEGDGAHARVRVGYEKDHANRAWIEYARADTAFYAAGNIATRPGRESVGVEAAYSPAALGALVTAEVHRTEGSASGTAADEWGTVLTARADGVLTVAGGDARGYALARYDRTPYDAYDYRYVQGAAGCSYRRDRLFVSLSLFWSRISATADNETAGAGGEVRWEVLPSDLTARASTRWTFGTGDDDSTRATHTLALRYRFDAWDLETEYRYLELEDRATPDESYTEHVGIVRLGRRF